MAEVALDGITKRFGETVAVDSLSFTARDGELLVLLGPTGAGKTTTLRLAAGLEAPDAGTVAIGGRDVTHAAPHARDVAFVFQQYSLYPHYRVYDNLAFPLRSPVRRQREEAIRARVAEVAELLRIGDKLDNRVTTLSGGEMQRVAIGRALVRSPAAYLMDEPLSSLDAKLRDDLRVELKRIQLDLGTTLLYVTHDQTEALTMADRIGVLDQGRLAQVGSPREIYEDPTSIYVAQRLGTPQVNVLPPGAFGLDSGPSGTSSIGVRPENVRFGADGGAGARVTAVEHLGAETVIAVASGGVALHALAPAGAAVGEMPAPGDTVTVSIDRGSALFFDSAGDRLKTG